MEKSLFAGLTILDPDESILEDNGAFTKRDRQTIDRFLELGAKTHRHDGTDGLANPPSEMDGTAVASAGQIPADISFSLAYTLEDDQGGETLLSPQITVATPSVIEPPTFAPEWCHRLRRRRPAHRHLLLRLQLHRRRQVARPRSARQSRSNVSLATSTARSCSPVSRLGWRAPGPTAGTSIGRSAAATCTCSPPGPAIPTPMTAPTR